jgi:hypothetical protein
MSDEIFDPEIHAHDPKTMEPTLNKDGSFRKKRRDAGKTNRTRAKSTTGAGGAKGAANDQRSRYVKAVVDTAAPIALGLSLVDPVDAYCAQQLTPMWGEVLADLAMEQPRLAAVLERAAGFGAVGGVVALGVLTVAQFAHNHGKLPGQFVRMVGGQPREDIEQLLQQRGEQLRREQPRQHPEPAPEPEHAQGVPADVYAAA